jgi:hypothetical protein
MTQHSFNLITPSLVAHTTYLHATLCSPSTLSRTPYSLKNCKGATIHNAQLYRIHKCMKGVSIKGKEKHCLKSSRTLPPPPRRQQSQFRPPRNPFREQPSPLGPRRTLPPPYPHQRTTGQHGHDSQGGKTAYPVDEGSLGVEQVELVVETSPSGGDTDISGIRDIRLTKWCWTAYTGIARPWRDHLRGRVLEARCRYRADISVSLPAGTHLETSRTPVDELDGPLGLDVADGSVDVLGDNISSVQ